MARVRMVTRTIETTIAHLLIVNVQTSEVSEMTVTLNGHFETTEEVEKKASQKVNTTEVKVVAVKSFENQEDLYGMLEEDFIQQAKILPKREETVSE